MMFYEKEKCIMDIKEFTEKLGSSAPAPGGGGVAALCGALSAALSSMVCALTAGKKKYECYAEDISRLAAQSSALADEFLRLMEEDEKAFLPLSRAYGMPKDAEGRDEIMENALKAAAAVPFAVLGKCGEAAEAANELSEKGSRMVISDAGVSAAVCEAAAKGAVLNIFANTKLMKDRAEAEKLNAEATALAEHICGLCARAYANAKNYVI